MNKLHKDNISKAMKGKMPKFIPNNKGIKRTETNKKKISDTLKKKVLNHPGHQENHFVGEKNIDGGGVVFRQ